MYKLNSYLQKIYREFHKPISIFEYCYWAYHSRLLNTIIDYLAESPNKKTLVKMAITQFNEAENNGVSHHIIDFNRGLIHQAFTYGEKHFNFKLLQDVFDYWIKKNLIYHHVMKGPRSQKLFKRILYFLSLFSL